MSGKALAAGVPQAHVAQEKPAASALPLTKGHPMNAICLLSICLTTIAIDAPPADALGARRFRLPSFLFGRGVTFHPTLGKEEWRGLRSESAGRWAGLPRRSLAIGAVARPNGPWPPFGGQDLAA